jgi:predicted acetyltransferase
MTPEFRYTQSTRAEDVHHLGNILDQCFINIPGSEENFINQVGVENIRLMRDSDQIAGGLAMISMGQWWGGQCIPMVGIAGVGIAPEYRGTGVAANLIRNAVKELYSTGVPISVLYPAVQRLYRKAGYEQAGCSCIWEVPTKDMKQEVLFTREKETVYAYLLGATEQPQGYIIFSQHQENDGSVLRVRDWVVLTTAAANTFWSFLANHSSQVDKIRWTSSAVDLLSLLLPEQSVKQKRIKRWQLRVIDIIKALEQRGYPLGIQAELHLLVQDDLVPENNGKFILNVADGRGQVAKGGKGDMKLDISGLAPLYTGLFTPRQLQLAGRLDATEVSLVAAAQLFAGVSPSMPDFF